MFYFLAFNDLRGVINSTHCKSSSFFNRLVIAQNQDLQSFSDKREAMINRLISYFSL